MNYSEISNQKILYAALDWGLGHVTRSIGIIRDLLENQNKITIACNSEQENLFKSYFPDLEFVFLEGYNFQFSGLGNWSFDLWKQRRSFFKSIADEHNFVENFTNENHIDLIISDHRYGFYSEVIPSIFVTHQLHLPLSSVMFFVQKWHERQLKKFSSIWVLDDESSSLAGKLSRKIKHKKLDYISWKSRFQLHEKSEFTKKYDYLIVVSGPRPYSEFFIEEVSQKVDLISKKVAVIYPKEISFTKKKEFEYFAAENLKDLDELFYISETIISRCGYSTLMDLKILNKKSILFPTKGQKEQAYLYKWNKISLQS